MSSNVGTHGHVATATWPRIQWSRIQSALAGEVAVVRSSLAAGRAYEDARSDAERRRVLAGFLDTLR